MGTLLLPCFCICRASICSLCSKADVLRQVFCSCSPLSVAQDLMLVSALRATWTLLCSPDWCLSVLILLIWSHEQFWTLEVLVCLWLQPIQQLVGLEL